MFEFAIITGVFSYSIFFAGLTGHLYNYILVALSALYVVALCLLGIRKKHIFPKVLSVIKLDTFSKFLIGLLFAQSVINLIGVFGPEISFDALWYHLTLPKIYLLSDRIFFITGGLLYYSAIPKLTEMIYVAGLSLGGDAIPKLIHYMFGILSIFLVYKISRNFLPIKFALLAAVVFYSNLVIGWESIAAYIDLARTFYELLAVFAILQWSKSSNESKWLILSSLMIGFAITAKLLSVFSLAIILLYVFYRSYSKNHDYYKSIRNTLLYLFIAIIIPMPWFIFSIINTGNPIYPVGNYTLNQKAPFLDILKALEDPISPVYLIFLPLFIVRFKDTIHKFKFILFYGFLGIISWYLLIRSGGGRYLLPYLAMLSIVIAYLLSTIKNKSLKMFSFGVIIFVAFVSIGYRGIANAKFIPVITGNETKQQFLTKYLNFSYGDFYDTDGYFKSKIKTTDTVLLFGFHNLYYVDFPFIDSSYVTKGDKFNYIAVQNSILPIRFRTWKQIYYNKLTGVKLYTNGGKIWVF